ncbi:TRAP transporter small permease subunit [Lonepinella koalarum]|uniref:TRAP transporter small permease n=1 Tax=Lonepinella TaxID=53416 RepID=UPI0011E45C22|nr:TRAP transporter small permease subunit [Lonepinella koalarum]TYG34405.1 TRAP transporter small permease subunit [Lonepinella koalarum]
MSEVTQTLAMPKQVQHNTLGKGLFYLSQSLAIVGGFMFIALILMSCYSLISRKLGYGGVLGDIEIMQMGCAVASSFFLPFCTIMAEHLKVDFFTAKFPASLRHKMDALADLLLCLVAFLLAWRIGLQSESLKEYEEVSALLSFPTWIPNIALLFSFSLMGLCAFYTFCCHLSTKE